MILKLQITRLRRVRIELFLCFVFACFTFPSFLAAERASSTEVRGPFLVTEVLRPYVDFWKMIFSKYGEHQAVFHHRQYPGIVYSVLDFSALAENNSPRDLARQKSREVDAETARISNTLERLAKGEKASDAFERRVARLFTTFRNGRGVSYRAALDEGQIRFQTGIRERFAEGVKRSSRYLHAIEQIFADYALPVELSRLPLVESSFDYTAYSSVGAAGIWQFMRSTGKKYMRIDSYIDERRDPIVATRAAAQYLAHAYKTLEAWPLAVTSYNHGITGVLRAAKSTGSRNIETLITEYDGESFGFASQNFYAEFLAAVEVERNASQLFPELVRDEPWYFDEVRLGRSLGINQLASFAGVPLAEIQRLNPALLKPISSGRVSIPNGVLVKVPHNTGTKVVRSLGGGTVVTESFYAEGRVINSPGSSGASKPIEKKKPSTQPKATAKKKSGRK